MDTESNLDNFLLLGKYFSPGSVIADMEVALQNTTTETTESVQASVDASAQTCYIGNLPKKKRIIWVTLWKNKI